MTLGSELRYLKSRMPLELWRQARAKALMEKKTVTQWLSELIQWAIETDWKYEKLEKTRDEDCQRPRDS